MKVSNSTQPAVLSPRLTDAVKARGTDAAAKSGETASLSVGAPGLSQAKLDELKSLVKSGEFVVDPAKVAPALVAETQDFLGAF